MARVLPDREISALLGKAILNGSPECIRVQAYEVRLGERACFDSTGEEVVIPEGSFLEIEPGDFVSVESLEKLDFGAATLSGCGKASGIFAWITPTTTMMREGFLFASTKVDAGYQGNLNWGIRNSSIKTVRLKRGERLFKLTFMELSEDEKPDKFYGDSPQDHYQGTSGIKESARTIPVDIPERYIVRRTQRKIDPIKQLAQAGYPFNHIGTELISIQGQFTVVSQDVAALRHGMESLEKKIETEASTISTTISGLPDKIDAKMRSTFAEQFGLYFDQRMQTVYGTVLAMLAFAGALYKLVIESAPAKFQGYVLLAIGGFFALGTLFLIRSRSKK